MNSEFNGRPERSRESEGQFWRSMEELLPIFEREGIQLRLEPHPDDFIEDGREAVDMVRGIDSPQRHASSTARRTPSTWAATWPGSWSTPATC